ncbi:MAG: L-threonine 3-dehydrogenase [Acidimicrobiia bacterium]|nr:L-threonine 3-dehydrogenase [Acidimicrobiia bacterium]MDH3398785.1 L-threonine 3-dehydrogenase [Acidimicrobiia bacterium]
MRAIVKKTPGPGLDMVDLPLPEVGDEDVLIQVKATSICGTDLHIYEWNPWAQDHVKLPLTVGHELCGVVADKGANADGPEVGQLVSVESHVVCNRCSFCRSGKGHLCENTQILGVHRDGAYAEYVAVPAINAWVDPPEMPYSIASLQENFGNAVHTASVPLVAGRKVLVTGCGPVGVMAIAAAKALGARSVYATDVSDYRLSMAWTMGADLTINPIKQDVFSTVMDATEGEGVDVLLEMSGAPTAIDEGFRSLKAGGEAALLGLTSAKLSFNLDDHIIFKGASVYGIVGRKLWDTWYEMRGLLRSGAIDLAPLITHRFALDDYEKAFDLMATGDCGKVVMFPDPADADGLLS